ncbi:unnamed protein product [Mycena citricolor]|uniref:Ricin B lectin domain-containing protein n=1 Tax=Mycena citricolor TaxID=2018698 RepID=A0AAD2Q2Z6_9AGAR|nr:unnamed protein product [Mycena citricolor]
MRILSCLLLAALMSAQTPPQVFSLAYIGTLLIQPGLDGTLCITASSNNTVSTKSCTGSDSQKWTFVNGSIQIFNGTQCLAVALDNTQLQLQPCAGRGAASQQFWYTYDNHIAWTNHGRCLHLSPQLGMGVCDGTDAHQTWNVGYPANALPTTSEHGQSGTNACGAAASPDSACQTVWINSADDFCLWAPPSVGTIGDTERDEVAWCTMPGHGARLVPPGTFHGVHFVKTADYVQVTGVGNFTSINIPRHDQPDPHGADGNGNPIGGLVFGNSFSPGLQYHEWTSFISDTEFCFRACIGPNAARNCQHIYDLMGCYWNMPANYDAGSFDNCEADDDLPMGVYGTSTWYQGIKPTPPPHPVASSSRCVPVPSPT